MPARLSPSLAQTWPTANSRSSRAIFDAIFYVLRTGCPWRYLPANFPPWPTVFYHFRRLRRVWDLDALVYGRCTALDANDKEGILTQVPKAWILKA